MPAKPSSLEIPLPRGWPSRVKSAILHVISLAQFTLATTRGWAANRPNSRIRLKAELDRTDQQSARLREELRIENLQKAHKKKRVIEQQIKNAEKSGESVHKAAQAEKHDETQNINKFNIPKINKKANYGIIAKKIAQYTVNLSQYQYDGLSLMV